MSTKPPIIWMQFDPDNEADGNPTEELAGSEITWCVDQVNNSDTAYVLVPDGIKPTEAVVVSAALMQALREWAKAAAAHDAAWEDSEESYEWQCRRGDTEYSKRAALLDQLKGPEDAR